MTEDPRIDPADLRNVRFPGSSRRYEARSVDQFLETVAARIAATNALVDELQNRLAELDDAPPVSAPAPPRPELGLLDDEELVKLVGEETASVLSTARRAADEIRSKAEESAARMIREATTEADRLTSEARSTANDLTSQAEEALERATGAATEEAERIRSEATEEAERLTAEAQELLDVERSAVESRRAEVEADAERILEEARDEGRGMVNEAKEVRSRILEDLQRRRDTARDQIERLLAGRERLLAAYDLVRENLDDITGQLADALPDPGEPELPDGFVGIVTSTGPVARDEGHDDDPDADEAPADDTVTVAVENDGDAGGADEEASAAEPDDTIAPVTETEADIAEADIAKAEADIAEADEAAESDETGVDEVPDEPVDAEPSDAEPAEVESSDEPATAAPDEPTELDADEAEAHGAAPSGDVDELFARLRAEREQSVAKARQVVEADAVEEAGVPDAAEATDEPAPTPGDVEEASTGADDADAEVAAGDVDRIPSEFLADADALAARADALGPLETKLNRALKRRLADEQNELLDLLRRSGTTTADDLLPPLDIQVAGYADLAATHLASAASAGGRAGGAEVDVDVSAVASALGAALVEPFRRRVERSAAEVDGDADELDERLRALYREWKVQHVGPVADDALLSAYALGTLSSAPADGHVQWRIDPSQGPCPDAQDNALAGEVPTGDAFPTGDACPQAHPGCRCLLVTG